MLSNWFCSASNVINFWSFTNNEIRREHQVSSHEGTVNQLSFNHNNAYLISGGEDGQILLTNTKTKEKKFGFRNSEDITVPPSPVTCICLSSGSRYICSGDRDKVVKLWDIRNKNNCLYDLKVHRGSLSCVMLSGKDNFILSASVSGQLLIHDINQGKLLHTLQNVEPNKVVRSLSSSPTDSYGFCSISDDGSCIIWDSSSGSSVLSYDNLFNSPGQCIRYNPLNGSIIGLCSLDNTFKLLSSISKEEISSINISEPLTCLSWSQDGNYIVLGTLTGNIHLFDTKMMKVMSSVSCSLDKINSIEFTRSTPSENRPLPTLPSSLPSDQQSLPMATNNIGTSRYHNLDTPTLKIDNFNKVSSIFSPTVNKTAQYDSLNKTNTGSNIEINRYINSELNTSLNTSVQTNPLFSHPNTLFGNDLSPPIPSFIPKINESEINRKINTPNAQNQMITSTQPVTPTHIDILGNSPLLSTPKILSTINKPPGDDVFVDKIKSTIDNIDDMNSKFDFNKGDRIKIKGDSILKSNEPPKKENEPVSVNCINDSNDKELHEQIQLTLIQSAIEPLLFDLKFSLHQDFNNLKLEMIKQFEIQYNDLRNYYDNKIDELQKEIRRLKENNDLYQHFH